ncbi:hypothetical protein B296_00046017, partial [Ensete ventricosum]
YFNISDGKHCAYRPVPISYRYRDNLGTSVWIEPEKEDTEEESQPAISTIHALAGYANPHSMKVNGFLEHQPITIPFNTGNTNNFMDSKVAARLTLWIEEQQSLIVLVAFGIVPSSPLSLSSTPLSRKGIAPRTAYFVPWSSSCINPKSPIFGYLDEKPIDIGLMKFLGLCPSVLS